MASLAHVGSLELQEVGCDLCSLGQAAASVDDASMRTRWFQHTPHVLVRCGVFDKSNCSWLVSHVGSSLKYRLY